MRKIYLSNLLKLEFRSFVEEVIRIISKSDTKALHIDATFQVLIAKRPFINLLDVPYRSHPLSKEITFLNKKCLNYAALIASQMRGLKRIEDARISKLIDIAGPATHFYLDYLSQKKLSEIHGMLKSFFIELREKPEIKEAIVALGYEGYLDELQNAHIAYNKLIMERIESKAKRSNVDPKAIQKDLEHWLRLLFNQIDLYQYAYPELNYRPMINELNVLISNFSRLINVRAANNKMKATKTKKIKEKKTASPKKIAQKDKQVTEKKKEPLLSIDELKEKEKHLQNLIEMVKASKRLKS